MNLDTAYPAIYDFGLLPYALGDVLTWNIQTAIRAEAAGMRRCNIYICNDKAHPANLYQRELVLPENSNLFFNELFPAFDTHPYKGNLYIYRSRDDLIKDLDLIYINDNDLSKSIIDYRYLLNREGDEEALKNYFLKYLQSHQLINEHFCKYGRIPLLGTSEGCEPDSRHIREALFGAHRIVAIHPRMRRLDAGIKGEHTYYRDSDFLEWYEFLKEAARLRPDIKFLVLGRLHEKPLHLLRLPNVISLRALGFGLGHELTLLRETDLFIGASSGFAAFANFSEIPYFITRMSSASAEAYGIPDGEKQLPFATANQHLIYGAETNEALQTMLETVPSKNTKRRVLREPILSIEPEVFQQGRRQGQHEASLSSRFRVDADYADREAAFLLWPRLQDAFLAFQSGDHEAARSLASRLIRSFPRLKEIISELAQISAVSENMISAVIRKIKSHKL